MIVNIYCWRETDCSTIVELPDRIGENIEEYIKIFHKYIVSNQTCEHFYTYAFEYVDDRMPPSEKISDFLYYLRLYHLEDHEKYTIIKENAPLDPQYKSAEL